MEVAVIDHDPDALVRIGEDFDGRFEVGQGLDTDLLERVEVSRADAFVASTDDDNTNLVIAQIALKSYGVANVVVRVCDPEKAEFYSRRGLRVVCPTNRAIGEMTEALAKGPARRAVAGKAPAASG